MTVQNVDAVAIELGGRPRLFGWFHRPDPAHLRACGVVLCNPFAEAALSTHRTYRVLANHLAAAGFPVLRFDYDGTGDSAGVESDPGRLRAWINSIHAAVDSCKSWGGVEIVSLFGLRFGATLALLAANERMADERSDIVGLMLWAPVVSGRKFVRELKLLNATSAASRAQSVEQTAPFDGIEAAGFRHSAETIVELNAINLLKLPAPAMPCLVLHRDEMVLDSELLDHWGATAENVTNRPDIEGYSLMMRDAQYSTVPNSAIDALGDWMVQLFPERPADVATIRPVPKNLMVEVPVSRNKTERVYEQPVWFQSGERRLFGIVSRPEEASTGLEDTAVILINAGGNHRIGPSRLAIPVTRFLATLGCTILRFDLAGIGDSQPILDKLPIFDVESVRDVNAAIDFLSRFGSHPPQRFVLLGLCSGGFLAMHTAMNDSRVSSQILMNLPAFEATPDTNAERIAKLYIRPLRFYAEAVLRFETWKRVVSGRVDLRRILVSVMARLLNRLTVQHHLLLARLQLTRNMSISSHFRALGHRGVKSLIVVSANDSAVDELETHLGKNASRMDGEPNFRLVVLKDADHTFSANSSRRNLLRTLRSHFGTLRNPPEPEGRTIQRRSVEDPLLQSDIIDRRSKPE